MIKKVFHTFDFKTKKNLGIFLILSIIFVFVEVSLIGSLYPIFQNFFSENTNNNFIMNYLNSFFRLDTQEELIFFVLVLIVLRFIYFIYFNLHKNKLLQDLQKKIAEKIFKNFFTLKSYSEFINYNSSTLIRDLANETQTFKKFINVAISLFVEILLVLSISIFLIFLDSQIYIFSIIFLILFGMIYFLILKSSLTNLGEERIKTSKDIIKNISEAFRFFEIIKIQKKLNYFLKKNSKNYEKLKNVLVKTNVLQVLPRIIIETLFFLLILSLVYFISKSSNINSELSTLSIFFVSFLRIYPSFIRIISSIQDLNLFKKSVDGIYNQIKNQSHDNDQSYDSDQSYINSKSELKDSIKINQLNFKYNSNIIFKDFNFELKKNSFNAIIGPSGSGKSTLIKTLLGLVKPNNIKIYFDDNEKTFENLNLFFKKKVGYAGQNNFTLNSTLFENITLEEKKDNLNFHYKEKLKNTFISSGLEEFFKFETDLDKIITEEGKNVSGGQIQRICLARALYFSDGVLVLDEICSSLDLTSEEKIIKTLKILSKNYMIIYITHRNNFHHEFDQVIEIN
tara:strand:+ start:1472 stop:3172 length:1701 start_codon:yes stop_codon:yes gene_type:complete